MGLQEAMGYSDTILRKSVEVPESLQLAWLSRNDHLTRTRVVSHVLERAMQETVEWAVIPSASVSSPLEGPSHRPLDQLDRPAGAKRAHPIEPPGPPPPPPPPQHVRRTSTSNAGNAGSSQPTVTTLRGNKTLCKCKGLALVRSQAGQRPDMRRRSPQRQLP